MTSPANQSFTKREPVVVGAVVTWLFSVVGTFLVGHTSLISSTSWSGLSTVLVPVVTAVVLGVVTTLVRKYVTPFWKSLSSHVPDLAALLNTPEGKQFLETGLKNELNNLGDKYPQYKSILLDIQALEAGS